MFIFVEADHKRFAHLKATVNAIVPTLPKNFTTHCLEGNFDEQLSVLMTDLDEQKRLMAPVLAFIDPFGFSQTPFQTVARILLKSRSEVVLTFMYEEINRFLSFPDQARNYDRLFGTSEWRSLSKVAEPERRKRGIHDLYLAQLRTVAKYVRSFEMLNSRNRTDYFLFFATNNIKGLEKMKEAMWKADPGGGSAFSDYTDARTSLPLFETEPDYVALEQMIRERFQGSVATSETIGDYVVGHTPFLRTQYKTRVLKAMEERGDLVVIEPKPGRRRGTFPDGTQIEVR